MAARRSKTPSTSTARTARLAVGVFAALLLLVNVAGWLVLVSSWRTQEDIFEQGLRSGAALISGAFTVDNLFFLEASYDPATGTTDLETFESYRDLPSARALMTALAATDEELEGMQVRLVSLGGVVLGPQGFAEEVAREAGERVPEELVAALDDVRLGEVALVEADGRPGPKHLLQPVLDREGEAIAALWLRSTARPGTGLGVLARRLAFVALLSAAVVLALWWLLNRLIARSERAELEAARSDRLRALGAATAGIAHEIRNPLGIMLLSVEELASRTPDVTEGDVRDDLEGLLRDLREETMRLRDLTDQFLNLARTDEEPVEPLRLRSAVEAAARLFEKGKPEHVALHFDAGSGDPHAAIAESRLRQVLLNLLANAAEAIPEGTNNARITVRLLQRGGFASIEIEDNGRGMDAEALRAAFDPFHTTRADGMGLGLSLSRSLIEHAGGTVELESEPGRGTLARVRLPLAGR